MSAQIVSLVSSKGSVGKSTVAINLASALGDAGINVLLVDLDSQQSLSKFFIYDDEPTAGLVEFITTGNQQCISKTHIGGVDIIVNNDNNEKLNEWMNENFSGSFALKSKLGRIRDQYDVILIDTQGKDGRGQLQEMALIAADTVIVPTTPDIMASQELPRAIQIYSHVIDGLKQMGIGSDKPPALKILINRVDHTTGTREVTAHIREKYGSLAQHISVMRTFIPQRVVWKDCITEQVPAHRLDKRRNDERSAILVMESFIHELLPHYADITLGGAV